MGARLLYQDAHGRDRAVDLPEAGAFLGRALECLVRTDDAMVSRRNCKISQHGGRWIVEDLNSANGTFINEQRIQRVPLSHGDVIRCGSLQLRFAEIAVVATDERGNRGATPPPGAMVSAIEKHYPACPPPASATLEAPRSEERSENLDSAFQRLKPGWLGVDAPRVASLGVPMKIKVLVTRNELLTMLLAEAEHPDPMLRQARLGQLVRVELKPDILEAFLIEPLSPAEQPILTAEVTGWEWIITPRLLGKNLTLRVLATNLVDVVGRVVEKSLPSQAIRLEVRLDVSEQPQPFEGRALQFFCIYAPKDRVLREELETHLSLLRRQGAISLTHDHCLLPGTEQRSELDSYLQAADVILLLVSADLLDSDFCYLHQMMHALERHGRGSSLVLPIQARAVDCRGAPFGHLPTLPRSGRAVTLWPDRDEAWLQVSTEIRALTEKFTARQARLLAQARA